MTGRRYFHNVAMTSAQIRKAIKSGTEIEAWCGHRFIPSQEGPDVPTGLPECRECFRHIYRGERNQPHLVYRCYDESGRLIYVGCTGAPLQRADQHRLNTWWYPQVARTRYVVFPDRQYALAKEREAIATENPRWNIRGRDRGLWTVDDYADCYTAMRENGSDKKAEQLAVQAYRRFGYDISERWSA